MQANIRTREETSTYMKDLATADHALVASTISAGEVWALVGVPGAGVVGAWSSPSLLILLLVWWM